MGKIAASVLLKLYEILIQDHTVIRNSLYRPESIQCLTLNVLSFPEVSTRNERYQDIADTPVHYRRTDGNAR